MSNLAQRILTAAVLLALFIPALVVETPWPFVLLTLLMIGAAAWEWSRLIGWTGWRAWASGAFCAGCVFVLFGLLDASLSLCPCAPFEWMRLLPPMTPIREVQVMCLFWLAGVPWLLWRGVARWPALPKWLRWGVGMAALATAGGVVAITRWFHEVNFLLSVLALAWAADIGAYAFGRAFGGKLTGGRKLAPSISPGKTWEGAVGGFVCVLLAGAVWVLLERLWVSSSDFSLYVYLWESGPVWFLAGLALLTAMSIAGDLFESLVKRAAGAKDSSGLLPGHGGVLDRIDALLPTLPLAFLVKLQITWAVSIW